MKAPAFDYACPDSLAEALALMADPDTEGQPLAGGQSLMPMMNFRLALPDRLIDLNGLTELDHISDDGTSIRIGAMTRYHALEESPLVAAHLPLISLALPHIAHPAIRNRGTIGGSLALADPAAELPALMLALDAIITVVSVDGERRIPALEFFRGLYETALNPGEIIRQVTIPKQPSGGRFAFKELARRSGDYAMVGLAMNASADQTYRNVRLALFAISDRPIRSREAEAALEGHTPGNESAIAPAVAALDALTFHGDTNASPATKKHLAKVLLKRCLTEV